MPTVAFQIKGLDEMNRALQRFVQKAPAEAGKILFRQAEKVMAASKELVPVDTGFLRASGHVDLPVVSGSRVSVAMGYNADYAVHVHEDLTVHHPSGQAKYLERAILDAVPGLNATIAADFAKVFQGTI